MSELYAPPDLPEHLPDWLRKDVLAQRYEVPVAPGETREVIDRFYTERVFRFVLDRWLSAVPHDGDIEALRRALLAVVADGRTFDAHLRVPDAFGETYEAEVSKLGEHRAGLAALKSALPARQTWWRRAGWVTGLAVCAGAAVLALLAV